MKTTISIPGTTFSKTMAGRSTAYAKRVLLVLLLLVLPAEVQAQFNYTVTNNTITITRYTGPGGAVTVPNNIDGLPVTSIGSFLNQYDVWSGAFAWCTNLTSVTIPDTVTSIGVSAFADCTSLTHVTIGNRVASIGVAAFGDCTSLTNVTIPNSVTSIGDYAFVGCSSLTAIAVGALNPVYSSVDGVLFNKSQTTLITYPAGKGGSYTIPDSVISIGHEAFYYCTSLTNVTIGNSVTSIDYEAFYYCTSLTNVTIGNSVTSIGDSAFRSCPNLTSVTIPDTVTSIGSCAFMQCGNLTSVTIPNGVSNIGDFVFYGCTSLTSATIGNSVTNIGDRKFYDCYSLTSVTLGNSVTNIGDSAFFQCYSLTSVTIGNRVTNIGYEAFYDCYSLTSITIPASVTNIGIAAFEYCWCLAQIYFLGNAPSFGGYVFENDNHLIVYYLPGMTGWGPTFGGRPTALGPPPTFQFIYTVINGTITITGYAGPGGDVTIPDAIAGLPVTTIGASAFSDCYVLTSVTIPNSVTTINAAFWGCTRLTSATIGNSVTSIGSDAFGRCTSLTSLYFSGNAPTLGARVFVDRIDTPPWIPPIIVYDPATIYYLPGTTGWGSTFGGLPTALWPPPTIQSSPLTQTAEARSAVGLRVQASSPLPLFYLWYLNQTNLLSSSTNCELELSSVQLAQSGAYTVVISNVLGAITSAPAMLNVIAAVERRPVPGVKVTGEAASLLNVDAADSLSPAPNWSTLGSVSLTSTSQYYFDLTLPLPPQRFYRAWHSGAPSAIPSLDLHMVPAITLTGNIGGSVRLDYINRFGPTDAWVWLDTITLTNTSQLYFDTSVIGQPQRLYRLVPMP